MEAFASQPIPSTEPAALRVYRFGPFRMIAATRQLWRDAEEITLPPKSFDLLLLLVTHRDRVLEKDEMRRSLWPDSFVSEGNLTQSIAVLRRALGDDSNRPTFITTVSRHGYRFIAPVVESVGDRDVETVPAPVGAAVPPLHHEDPPRSRPARAYVRRPPVMIALGLLTGIGLSILVQTVFVGPSPAPTAVTRFMEHAPPGTRLMSGGVLSPEGRHLAFVAESIESRTARVWVRALDAATAHPLAGTEQASGLFWSPDGQSVAFFAGGKLKRVDLAGESAQTIAETGAAPGGGSWGADGTILFARYRTGLYAVPAVGGQVRSVTTLDHAAGEAAHLWPDFLPDGRHYLYSVASPTADRAGTYLGSLDSHERVRLLSEQGARYAAPGYLLFVRDRSLLAQRFELSRRRLSGDARTLASNLSLPIPTSVRTFSASVDGMLAFSEDMSVDRLVWFDRGGRRLGAIDAPAVLTSPRFTPDEKELLATSVAPEGRDVWLVDLDRETLMRFVSDGRSPVVSPDGASVAFASERNTGILNLYAKRRGSEQVDSLLQTNENKTVSDWSGDGRYLVYVGMSASTRGDLWMLPLFGNRTPIPVLRTPFNEVQGRLSPDGRRLAYTSDESGRYEVYVQSLPIPGERRVISVGGGSQPQWRGDGRELFYLSADQTVMAVDVTLDPWRVGRPTPLFQASIRNLVLGPNNYVATADGQRFLIDSTELMDREKTVTMLVNWTQEVSH
jgi:eukaryotic-like serine/threonine-protein kinase